MFKQNILLWILILSRESVGSKKIVSCKCLTKILALNTKCHKKSFALKPKGLLKSVAFNPNWFEKSLALKQKVS